MHRSLGRRVGQGAVAAQVDVAVVVEIQWCNEGGATVTRWQEGHAGQGEERMAVGEAVRPVCEGINGLGSGGVACLLDFLHVGLFFFWSLHLLWQWRVGHLERG
jgi:hypothetical protein